VSAVGRELAARDRDPSRVFAALVAVAREAADAERRSDIRDGLVEMPHAFGSAAKPGSGDRTARRMRARRARRPSRRILRPFAARPDGDEIAAMSSVESSDADDSRTGGRRSP
jgi:hypothetical protein